MYEKQQIQEEPFQSPAPFFLKMRDKDAHKKDTLPVPWSKKHSLSGQSQENA